MAITIDGKNYDETKLDDKHKNAVVQEIPAKFKDYEEARKARTARIQRESRGNQWLKEGGNADWVYGYDAWSVSL